MNSDRSLTLTWLLARQTDRLKHRAIPNLNMCPLRSKIRRVYAIRCVRMNEIIFLDLMARDIVREVGGKNTIMFIKIGLRYIFY